MSFKLFDQGYTAEQIKGMHDPSQNELMAERVCKWAESEHVLNMIRSIKAWNQMLDDMQATLWVKSTKRRR